MEERDNEARLRRGIFDDVRKQISFDRMKDLSVLATILEPKNTEAAFKDMVTKYSAKKDEKTFSEGRAEIMAKAAEKILSYEFKHSVLMNDSYIVQNADYFEKMNRLLGVFKTMQAENPEFMEHLNEVQRDRLTEQINCLDDVGAFYKVRKMIIENPYYRTHYNEELSLNADEKDTPEKKLLAKLLRTSFYLGKNLHAIAYNEVPLKQKKGQKSVKGIKELKKITEADAIGTNTGFTLDLNTIHKKPLTEEKTRFIRNRRKRFRYGKE